MTLGTSITKSSKILLGLLFKLWRLSRYTATLTENHR